MPISTPRLQISPPVRGIPYGRGFYQLEEESLYLPIEYPGERTRFYSCLESSYLSLQFDRVGRLIFIELDIPRRLWKIKDDFVSPERAAPAEVRFLDFRQNMLEPRVFCDHNRDNLLVIFGRFPADKNIYLAENLIAQMTSDGLLTAIWASDFADDLAGREIAWWRRSIHRSRRTIQRTA